MEFKDDIKQLIEMSLIGNFLEKKVNLRERCFGHFGCSKNYNLATKDGYIMLSLNIYEREKIDDVFELFDAKTEIIEEAWIAEEIWIRKLNNL